jgi:hypothetical protein
MMLEAKRPRVDLRDPASGQQTQSEPLVRTRQHILDFSQEDVACPLNRGSIAGVAHRDFDLSSSAYCANLDGAVGRCESDRVVQQDADCLVETVRIGNHRQFVICVCDSSRLRPDRVSAATNDSDCASWSLPPMWPARVSTRGIAETKSAAETPALF